MCSHCARWNLTPLEERWEAVEECERRFGGSAQRYSKDGIGVSRIGGVELIRIGEASGPTELAAWRYSERYATRFVRGKFLLGTITTTVVGAGGVTFALGQGLEATILASVLTFFAWERIIHFAGRRKVVARTSDMVGGVISIRRGDIESLRLGHEGSDPGRFYLRCADGRRLGAGDNAALFRALARILASIISLGTAPSVVEKGLREIADVTGVESYLSSVIQRYGRGNEVLLDALPTEVLLAIEMLLNEASERRYLDGELAELSRDWQEAEEIAAISDDLLLPGRVSAWLARHRA